MAKSRKISRPRKSKTKQLPPGTLTKESSCAVCRMRKVKCSGGRPACALCIKGAVAEGRPASGVRCLYSASSVNATAADKELEAQLGGRGSKCAWGEKMRVEEEEEARGSSADEATLGPAPLGGPDIVGDADGEDDPTFPLSSTLGSPPSFFAPPSTAPSTYYLPIPPALAHRIQSVPTLSLPSFPAFPTSASTTIKHLERSPPTFASPRPPSSSMHQLEEPHAPTPRALQPVIRPAPSAAHGPPRPPAAPLAADNEPFGMDDFALFRRTALAPALDQHPPPTEPTSLDFLPPPHRHEPPPPHYVEPAPSLSAYWAPPPLGQPAPRRATYSAPALHLDTALSSIYDNPPARAPPPPHALAHPFSASTSFFSASGPPALGGLAAAYLASTPLEPLAAAAAAPSFLDGGDASFDCGLGLDLGFDLGFVPPQPQPQLQHEEGAQPSSAGRGSSASEGSAFFSMFRADPWDDATSYVVEESVREQEQQWAGEGFVGWSG
ncbi:hypothetical protein JCM9279_003130 [Rhodotorula babjevae]